MTMFYIAQDPTGTAKASVHRRVLQDPEFGNDIQVGSVLVLKNVSDYFAELQW